MQDEPEYSPLVSHLYQEPLQQWMVVEDLKLQILHSMSLILKADNKNNNFKKRKVNSTYYNYLIALED